MRRAPLLALLLLGFAPLLRGQEVASFDIERLPSSLAGKWLFRTGHDPAWASPFRERRNWQPLRVPAPWETQGFQGYNGHAWYRLTLLLSTKLAGEELGVDLGTIGDVDEVFLNGRRVGATGSYPPNFQKATIARRFYRLPSEAIRFGEHNELAIHVYNDSRFGGFLGPPPHIDRWAKILRSQVSRDIHAYVMATWLVTLALVQLALAVGRHRPTEYVSFAAFLVAAALFILSYTHWGPALIFSYNTAFRFNVGALLALVALFPPGIFALARRPTPVPMVAVQALLALGTAFAIVWREVSDLYIWVYIADASAVVVAAASLWVLVTGLRQSRWRLPLLVTAVLLLACTATDILVDLEIVPRLSIGPGELASPLALMPFSLVLSFALAMAWAEQRWGEGPDQETGLLPRGRFAALLAGEMERSRESTTPFSIALLRVDSSETGEEEKAQLNARTAQSLRRVLRQIDMVGRYSPDTFVILLAETEERSAMATVERLRRATAEARPAGRARLRAAAGVAQYRRIRHATARDLLAEAEAALYAALNEGGDCTATAP